MRVLCGKKVGWFSVKLWKVRKWKYGKIAYGTSYQNHQCRCENKMVSSDSECRRLLASKLEAPVCSCEVLFPLKVTVL